MILIFESHIFKREEKEREISFFNAANRLLR